MLNFGLIGNPLGHSISYVIHKQLFKMNKIDADYQNFEILPENFDKDFKNLSMLTGFNVTIPYKRSVFKFIDKLDRNAVRFDAINTVKNENGFLTGFNTDYIGFQKALSFGCINLEGSVLIGGTGGTSRMMAIYALEKGCNITIMSRTLESGNKLKEDLLKRFKNKNIDWVTPDTIYLKYDFFLNGTPVGMYPNIDLCPLPNIAFDGLKGVFDAIYNPPKTKLIIKAEALHINCVSGLIMLVGQAAAAQEIWLGVNFSQSQLDEVAGNMSDILNKFN